MALIPYSTRALNYADGKRRPWIAEIRGRCEQYGYARRFLRPNRDWSESGRKGNGPVLLWYVLKPNRVYEVHRHVKGGKTERVFISTVGGTVAEIKNADVEKYIDGRDTALRASLGVDVYTAARRRMAWAFDTFERVSVSFSGGKDSTVLLHLAAEEARRRRRKIGLLFIDWEVQLSGTISHIEKCYAEYADCIEPYWVALPLTTVNACSQIEPEWVSWDPKKRGAWVRTPPPVAITDPAALPFYRAKMTFEEFAPAFGRWYSQGKLSANLVGLRAAESLNRQRTLIARKERLDNKPWTTWIRETAWNCYPIYDWRVEDIWTYTAREGKSYNPVYDLMHQSGLKLSQMRIDEPFGDEARRGLWLYQLLEPDTWGRMASRVSGANGGALYCAEKGAILGNGRIEKPAGHTWKSFAAFLLDTMPPPTAKHYQAKIAVWVNWWRTNQNFPHDIDPLQDELPGDVAGKDQPSWRRVCKVLLGNDFWCKGLGFSPTKAGNQMRYQASVQKKIEKWSGSSNG